jgi:hypothetical protein
MASARVPIGSPGYRSGVLELPQEVVDDIVRLAVDRVQTSCGYAVPRMDLVEPRTRLDRWAQGKTDDELEAYRAKKNRTSIDGLPALEPAPIATP